MKLKKILAAVVIATSATSAFALSAGQVLTNSSGELVKNNFGECVRVNENRDLTNCDGIRVKIGETAVSLSTDAYFDFDKAILKQQGKVAIQQLAQRLNQRDANVRRIVVDGYTDSTGSQQYNLGLSQRRAASVAQFLVSNDVPASIIETHGHGQDNPAASNATKEGRAENRRVVVTVYAQVKENVQIK